MRRLPVIALVIIGLLILLGLGATPYVEYLWLAEMGQSKVFWTLALAYLSCCVLGALVGFVAVFASLFMASKCWPTWELRIAGLEKDKFLKRAFLFTSAVAGVLTGLVALPISPKVLVWLHQQPFGIEDPVFGKDVGFYIYSLPFWGSVLNLFFIAAMLATAAPVVYYVGRAVQMSETSRLPPLLTRHAFVLLGVFALLNGFDFLLRRYGLAVDGSGPAAGAGYVDANILAPSLLVLSGLVICLGIFLIAYKKIDKPVRQLGAIALVVGLTLVGLGVLPSTIQQYKVRPNEISLERPYIEYAIDMTWKAFGFEGIEATDFKAEQTLTREMLDGYEATLKNIRLWDPGPLKDSYQQLQSLRTYYSFHDVDIDRYTIEDTVRQVMLSAREIPMDQGHETWVNRHLQYTHGYGLAMNPVNEMTADGQPRFWIQDLPPRSEVDIEVSRPEIYYGEQTNWFVLANTEEQELDYAKGDKNVYTHYEGKGGIPVGGFFRRVALAIYFRDLNLLLSSAIKSQSRAMFHRNILDRVNTLAPFLEADDPYLVTSDGQLYWIIDLYTVSSRFPFSHRSGDFNYIRNSVKAIVNPYSGAVQLVVVEPDDPILKTYREIFPSLFTNLDDIDPKLKAHFRYPERLLEIQAQVYNIYHMTDPQVFYNKEDLWEFAHENYHGKEQTVQPYYIVMRLPGEEQPEFILMIPLVPKDKDNMIAWMAARCDGDNYGKLLLFQFPKESLVYGPRQIEARIDQDTVISQQLTLWEQKGSQVLRGKFLVIPVEDSLLYVEPLYIQANAARMPELKRVIVTSSNPESSENDRNAIVMRRTLDEALAGTFGESTKPVEVEPEDPTDPTDPVKDPVQDPPKDPAVTSVDGTLVEQALEHMERADEALKVHEEEMKKARALLEKARENSPTDELPKE
jgi:uncharacterized membrane protein (UPF0182 family)